MFVVADLKVDAREVGLAPKTVADVLTPALHVGGQGTTRYLATCSTFRPSFFAFCKKPVCTGHTHPISVNESCSNSHVY